MPAAPWILHVDLDQFLAAVEVRRRPELVGRPVVVGGDGDPTPTAAGRGDGVLRGAGLRRALRDAAASRPRAAAPTPCSCPSDRPAYDAASAEVMAALRTLPVVVEVWGWDEAFLGATTDDPRGAGRTRRRSGCGDATDLSCAVGIGETKLQAKTATGFAKPGGVARLTRADWLADDGRSAGHDDLGHRGPHRAAVG